MDGSMIELSQYRYSRAKEDLSDAELLLETGRYKSSVNRSYYAIFHALRSLTALDGFDSGKHSGIIAYVNRHYVKEGIFDKSFSKMIDSAYRLREAADYKDFEIISKSMAEEQLDKARMVLETARPVLEQRWQKIPEPQRCYRGQV